MEVGEECRALLVPIYIMCVVRSLLGGGGVGDEGCACVRACVRACVCVCVCVCCFSVVVTGGGVPLSVYINNTPLHALTLLVRTCTKHTAAKRR